VDRDGVMHRWLICGDEAIWRMTGALGDHQFRDKVVPAATAWVEFWSYHGVTVKPEEIFVGSDRDPRMKDNFRFLARVSKRKQPVHWGYGC
jgi:hypothetical protein